MEYYDPLFDEDRNIARAYLDSYGQPPDQRMAAIDQAAMMSVPEDMTQQPGPPVSMSDVPTGPMMSAPEPAMSQAPQPQPVAYTPAPQGEAMPGQAPPEMPQGAAPRGPTGLERYIFAPLMRGPSPGHVVPEHEQKLGYSIDRQAPVDRTRLEAAYARQGELGAEQGRLEHFSAEDDVDAARRRKVEQAAQLGQFQIQRQEMEQEHEVREDEYQKLVQESRVDPDVFWTRRNTGEKMLAAVGGFLMGLGGGADQFIRMIEGEREHAQEERDKEVGAARERLTDFRQRLYTPQAADAFEDAIRARIVAEDMRMMAAETAEAGTRIRGEEEAAKMETYAAEKEEAARRAEAGAIAEKVAVVPRQVVGASRGGTIEDVYKRFKASGGSDEQWRDEVLPRLQRGELSLGSLEPRSDMSPEKERFYVERQVRLPTGETVYAKDKEGATLSAARISSIDALNANLSKMVGMLRRGGLHAGTAERAEYQNLAARNKLLAKEAEDLGAITEADAAMVEPIIGEGGEDSTKWAHQTIRQLEGATQHFGTRRRGVMLQLYRDPHGSVPVVTDTEQGLGIEVD